MNFELLSCPSCSNPFNKEDRIPLMIPSCGHTLCSSCIQALLSESQSFVCPEDKLIVPLASSNLSEFPKNWMIIRLIEQKALMGSNLNQSIDYKGSFYSNKTDNSHESDRGTFHSQQDFLSSPKNLDHSTMDSTAHTVTAKQSAYLQPSESNFCHEHSKRMEFVCINHQCRVCANCALVGIHKNHEIRSEEDVLNEITAKADKLVQAYEEIDRNQTIMPENEFEELFNKKIKQKTRELEEKVHKEFEAFLSLVRAREKLVIEEINTKVSLLQAQLQTLNEFPADLKARVGSWKEGAQLLLMSISEKVDRGEIIYELLEDKVGFRPDVIKEGEKLVSEFRKYNENPIEILERELNKISIIFSKNTINLVESLCVLSFPDRHAKPVRSTTPETDVEPATEFKRLDAVNSKIRMSMENKYQNDSLLEFEWNELSPNDLLRNSYGLRNTFGRKDPQQTQPQNQQQILSKSFAHTGLPDIPEVLPRGSFGSPQLRQKKDHSPGKSLQIDNYSSFRTTTPDRAMLRKTGATRSISPMNAGTGNRSLSPATTKSGKSKKRGLKVPQKYEKVVKGIEAGTDEVADLFDADLGDSGVAIIGEMIRENTVLKTLKLVKNKMSDEGGIALVNALYQNDSLENLHLQQNLLTERTIEAFLELFRNKRVIKTIFFNRNSINLSKVKNKVREIQELGISISI